MWVETYKSDPVPQPQIQEFLYDTSDIYTPKDFPRYNPDVLIKNKGTAIYYRMMLDDQVKAVMRFKQYAVISRGYSFKIGQTKDGENKPEHEEMARAFDFILDSIRGSFSEKLISILSALENGFSITEKVYNPIDFEGKTIWGLNDLKLKPFDTFLDGIATDPYGNLTSIKQFGGFTDGKEVPVDKVIYFVYQPDIDGVFGESDLRAAYRSYWSKDIIIKFQNIFLERHASGFHILKATGSLQGQQKADAENFIKNLSAMTGGILPSSVDVKTVQPMRTDAFEKAISQHDKAIAKSILVPNLLGLTEQGATGSYAQSEVHFKAFLWILQAIANQLSEVLNEQLFRELARWNFGTDDFPRFEFEPLTDDQKEKIAGVWGDLVQKGAVTKSDPDEAWIRSLLGAPQKEEIEEETEPIPDEIPEETPIDNEPFIDEQDIPEEQKAEIKKEFAEKPWLRRVNFAKQEKELDKLDAKFSQDLADIMAPISDSIDAQVSKIVGDRSLGNVKPNEFEGISIPKGMLSKLRKTTRSNLHGTLNTAYDIAMSEIPRKAFARTVGIDKIQADRILSSYAMRITGVIEPDVLNAVQQVLITAIQYDKTLKQTIEALQNDTDLAALLPETDAAGRAINIPARLENIARTNNSTAWNQGRMSFFGDPDLKGYIQAYEYSAIMDTRTSEVCQALHGKIRKDWTDRTPPNHYQCRSILVPVTVIDNWSGKEDDIPSKGTPQKGFS